MKAKLERIAKLIESSYDKHIDKAVQYIKDNWSDYSGFMEPDEVIVREIKDAIKGQKYIYRSIEVESLDDINLRDTGIYWTWDEDKASSYWGDEDYRIILQAKINPSEVNWVETVEQYIKPQYAEDELRTKKSPKAKVYKVFKRDGKKYKQIK